MVEYSTSTSKGNDTAPRFLNNPFELGNVRGADGQFENYTSNRVVETVADGSADYLIAWNQNVVKGAFPTYNGEEILSEVEFKKAHTEADIVYYDVKIISGSTVTFANLTGNAGSYKVPSASLADGCRVAYVYDNVTVPQDKIPSIKVEMKNISLEAKARRITIYYSNIAAFQANQDYGFNLGDQLAEKAVGQLNYEIDTEIVAFLDTLAGAPQASLEWSKTLPVGVSKAEHYQGFAEILEIAKQIIYDSTQRFAPNYMVCASNIIPVLSFNTLWKPASTSNINGPYFAGTFGSLKVFVSPKMAAGEYIIGVNGDDYMSSAAVYAPYLAVTPTQLLQFNDGLTTQGWSTMYDLKALNPNLVIKGKITA